MDVTRLRNILHQMNNQLPLDTLSEMIERKTNGSLNVSTLNEILNKYYPELNPNDKQSLISELNSRLDDNMNLLTLFEYLESVIGQKIVCPILCFYSIANVLEKRLKVSTLEFIYQIKLSPNSELNINEFYKTITSTLKLDDLTTILVFKGLDYLKRGRIKVEDFLLVIDSYRGSNNNTTGNQVSVNTWVKGSKSVNYHLLPVKGNYKVLATLKTEINKNVKTSQVHNKDKQHPTASIVEEIDTRLIKSKDSVPYEDFDMIQILENFRIANDVYAPSYSLFSHLVACLNNSGEHTNKSTIAEIVKTIDKDLDGYVSYLDLANYLLRQYRHRSTSLAYRHIVYKIRYEFKLKTKEFFIKNGLDVNSEINKGSICDMMSRFFELEVPISRKIYDEMRIVFYHEGNLTIGNMIELLNEFIQEDKKSLEPGVQLDMNQFEEQVRKFVNRLAENEEGVDKLKSFRENIKCLIPNTGFLSMTKVTLQEYKINFIKPLKLDMSLGMAMFQLLKTITSTNEQILNPIDLILFLESYIEEKKDSVPLDKIVQQLEGSGPPLMFLFEKLFNSSELSKDYFSSLEMMRVLHMYYPSIPKEFLYQIIKHLDEAKTGYIKTDNIQRLLSDYSKRDLGKFIANKI